MTLHAVIFIVVAIALEVLGQTSFKVGASSTAAVSYGRGAGVYLGRTARSGWVRLGVAAYALEIPFGVAALGEAPLSVVFPLLSLSYCGVALTGWWFLGERLVRRQQVAIVLITIGAAMVSAPFAG